MLVTVITFLIYLLIIGLCFALVVWVLGLLGIPVSQQAIRIMGAIVFLIVLLWFVQMVLSGAHPPRLLTMVWL